VYSCIIPQRGIIIIRRVVPYSGPRSPLRRRPHPLTLAHPHPTHRARNTRRRRRRCANGAKTERATFGPRRGAATTAVYDHFSRGVFERGHDDDDDDDLAAAAAAESLLPRTNGVGGSEGGMRNAAADTTRRRKGSAAAARLSTKHRVVFSNRYLPRVFVFRDCVYIHAHTHTRHTPDAVRFFSLAPTAPLTPPTLRACVRACTAHIYRDPTYVARTRWGSLPIYVVVRAVRACVRGAIGHRGIRAGLYYIMRGSQSARAGGCRWEGVGKFKTRI